MDIHVIMGVMKRLRHRLECACSDVEACRALLFSVNAGVTFPDPLQPFISEDIDCESIVNMVAAYGEDVVSN